MKEHCTYDDAEAVLDANVLIDFYELGCLDLLFRVFRIIIIPRTLYEEELLDDLKVELRNQGEEYQLKDITTETGMDLYRQMTTRETYKNLTRHDKLVASIAGENNGICTTNEKLLRKACAAYEIRCMGTLGILAKSYDQGHVTQEELVQLLDRLVSDSTSCYLDPELVETFKDSLLNDD